MGQLAWGTVLQAGEFIDDQEGDFCGSSKAYGPYQARLLREGDYGKALINNENHVWFFLVSDTSRNNRRRVRALTVVP